MDFVTTHAPPIRVTIDGTQYDLPRFKTSDFKKWTADKQDQALRKAMAKIKDDKEAQARVMSYYSPPPIDIADLADEAKTAEGAPYVVRVCCAKAGVPADKVEEMIEENPLDLRTLSSMLVSANRAVKIMHDASGEPEPVKGVADPLQGAPHTPGDSPTTI